MYTTGLCWSSRYGGREDKKENEENSQEKKMQITTVVKVQNCGETDVKSMTITLAAVKDFIILVHSSYSYS